jgi:hypothetical protein
MLMTDGAVILLAGILIGRYLPARRRKPKLLPPVKPVCPCGHSISFHKDRTGACKWKREVTEFRAARSCSCEGYAGPTPVPEYYAPEIEGR